MDTATRCVAPLCAAEALHIRAVRHLVAPVGAHSVLHVLRHQRALHNQQTDMQGMQLNPGVPTIEGALRDALVRAGGIAHDNADKLASLRWSRAARTDKGVSALGQVVGAKLHLVPGLAERLQAELPLRVHCLGIKCAAVCRCSC